jgi:hypothetical protein
MFSKKVIAALQSTKQTVEEGMKETHTHGPFAGFGLSTPSPVSQNRQASTLLHREKKEYFG